MLQNADPQASGSNLPGSYTKLRAPIVFHEKGALGFERNKQVSQSVGLQGDKPSKVPCRNFQAGEGSVM